MPYNAEISKQFKDAKWKVKISEKETCEPPHMTICFKAKRWRFNLRSLDFMDTEPDPKDIPKRLMDEVSGEQFISEMRNKWNDRYPENPITSEKQ